MGGQALEVVEMGTCKAFCVVVEEMDNGKEPLVEEGNDTCMAS